jgi:transposase-like protein
MIAQTRKRTPIALILYALYLYFSSLSLRRASHVLEPIIKRSHVAIWKWIQKYSFVLDSFDVDKHDVNSIFINETEINVGWKKAMGSIPTSTQSVPIIPHKLAPELSYAFS